MIEIKNITKKYGNFTAVDNLNLNVKKGKIFGFLGPNGAGKTTTIKMMTGLTTITYGDITINGLSIKKDVISYKKQFALIPDKPYIFEKLRGIEYLKFVANLYDVKEETFKRLSKKYIDMFDAGSYMNDFIESYSHGMSQKLLIIASLIHEPAVLILDEPMIGLDPKSMKVLKEVFKDLAEKGMTVFMSTHSLELAEDVCTSIGIIDKGKLLTCGAVNVVKKKNKSKKIEEVFFRLTEEKENG
ncbi:MAG: ABC transporter ATP-binding protein [Candidatus Goldbacteria bacterium]|nr:ABC transporter ATP-binding protein [Candidatus Goldiibacteriota bacterium]HPD18212.1 ABC transporter ATP-binding protein [Candidatus Goldiibacteriota bacterium]